MQSDPHPPAPEALLENLDWVRRLSRSLVSDRNVGDDLAQEAWLSALETPPPSDRPLRAWLGRVVHNAARQRGRREFIRSRHERSAAKPERTPSDDQLRERIEQQKLVVEHVSRRAHSYRRTILLRYFEGLTPHAIASVERVSEATVKTRLRRGLQLLRVRLDRSHDGDRTQWILALSPLVRGPGFWIGATLVSTKTAVGTACAVAILMAGAFLWTRGGHKPEPAAGLASIGEVVSTVAPDLVVSVEPASPSGTGLVVATDSTRRAALGPEGIGDRSGLRCESWLGAPLEGKSSLAMRG